MIPDMAAQGGMRIAIEGIDGDIAAEVEVEIEEIAMIVTVNVREVEIGLIVRRGNLARIVAEVKTGTGEKGDTEMEAGRGVGTGNHQSHTGNEGAVIAPESHADRAARYGLLS